MQSKQRRDAIPLNINLAQENRSRWNVQRNGVQARIRPVPHFFGRPMESLTSSDTHTWGKHRFHLFDPILMLDSFDSTNPNEYTVGFPLHLHRGIETVSYVYRGKMLYKDSLGNPDMIGGEEVQWMSAGSGILHEGQIPDAERLLGAQLWLSLPSSDKMSPPQYHSIKNLEIQGIPFVGGGLRLLAGRY